MTGEKRYYIVRLVGGGCYRPLAESADAAREIITRYYGERVSSVALDEDQSLSESDDC